MRFNSDKFSKRDIIFFLLYFLLAVFIFRGLVFEPGQMGLRHDWKNYVSSIQIRILFNEELYSWSPIALGIPIITPFEYITRFFYFLSSPFVPLDMLTKLSFVGLTFLSGVALYYLSRSVQFSRLSSFVAGLFYMLTPVVFNKIVAGHENTLMGYAFFPIALALFIKSTQDKSANYKLVILTGLVVAVSITALQFIPIIFFTLLVYLLFTNKKIESMKAFLLVAIITALLHAPSFIMILVQGTSGLLEGASNTEWFIIQSPQLISTLQLRGYQPGYYENSVMYNWILVPYNIWLLSSFVLIIIIFASILINPKNKIAVFCSLLLIISIFITKGASPPFRDFSTWLFENIPLLKAFREVYHLMVFSALIFSMLLGYSLNTIFTNLKTKSKNNNVSFESEKFKIVVRVGFLSAVCVLFVIFIILLYAWPFFTGDFNGNIQIVNFDSSYSQLLDFLSVDDDFRVLYLPGMGAQKYNGSKFSGYDPLVHSPKPSVLGYYFRGYPAYLQLLAHQKKTNQFGVLAGLANIKYVIFRKDFQSDMRSYLYPGRYTEFEQSLLNEKVTENIKSQTHLIQVREFNNGTITVYENREFIPRLYLSKPTVVTGGLSSLISLSNLQGQNKNFPSFVFAQQSSQKLYNITDSILIKGNSYFDYVASYIPSEYKISPGIFAFKNSDAEKGWVDYIYWQWYDAGYTSSLERIALVRTSDKLDIPLSVSNTSLYSIFAKVAVSKSGSHLNFTLNGDEFSSSVITKADDDLGFIWQGLGDVTLETGEHTVRIESGLGENAIANIIAIPKDMFYLVLQRADESLLNKSITMIYEENDFELGDFDIIKNNYASQMGLLVSSPPGWVDNTFDLGWYRLDNQSATYNWSSGVDGVRFIINSSNPEFNLAAVQRRDINISLREFPYVAIKGETTDANNFISFRIENSSGTVWDFMSTDTPFKQTLKKNQAIDEKLNLLSWAKNKGVVDSKEDLYITGISYYIYNLGVVGTNYTKLKFISFNKINASVGARDIKARTTVYAPREGNYTFSFKVLGGKGHGKFKVYIPTIGGEGFIVDTNESSTDFYHKSFSTYLEKGNHTILLSSNETVYIDALLIYFSPNKDTRDTYAGKGNTVSFKRINPTKYVVSVVNATEPQTLVFLENYNTNWKVYYSNKSINCYAREGEITDCSGKEQYFDLNDLLLYFTSPIPEEHHFITNGYANAWYINRTGDFTLIVYYKPQSLYYVGISVALVTVVLCIIFLAFSFVKINKQCIKDGSRLTTRQK